MARNIDDIQRDIERTRRQLASTLDQIADRTNPSNMMDDAKRTATGKLQEPPVLMAIAGVAVAVAGIVALSVVRSRKRKGELKEIQRLLASRR